MFDFHGWIKLRESASEEGENNLLLHQCVYHLCDRITAIEWVNAKAEVLALNGGFTLVLNGSFNHRSGGRGRILDDLVEYVMQEFPGAFGIIYELDNEGDYPNVFAVRVIRRGQCEWRMDPFLSPIIPVVEDQAS